MILLFMRHGVTEYNQQGRLQGQQDFPLSEEGKKQVASVDKGLLSKVEIVYSSPLSRARESAQLLQLPCPLVLDQRLIERGFGSYQGRTFDELYGDGFDVERSYRDDDYSFHGVESLASMKRRLASFLEDISRGKEQEILVVSHGALGLCLRQMLPTKQCDIEDLADIKNCQILRFDL